MRDRVGGGGNPPSREGGRMIQNSFNCEIPGLSSTKKRVGNNKLLLKVRERLEEKGSTCKRKW